MFYIVTMVSSAYSHMRIGFFLNIILLRKNIAHYIQIFAV